MNWVRYHLGAFVGAAILCALPAHHATAAVPTPDQAPVALLVDLTSGQVLHERNADRRFIPASITKTMTALVAFDLMAKGKLSPEQSFTMRPQTHEEWFRKGSTMFIAPDEAVTVDNLLRGITAISANDGSIALAEGAAGSVENWVTRMNDTARAIGMHNSHFGTPNGWPDEGRTFTTARDLVVLAETLIAKHPEKYAQYFGKKGFRYGNVAQANYDPLIGRVKGADGIKTGFTNEAGHGFLGTAERDGRRLVMVIGGAPSEQARGQASRAYIEWGFAGFQSRQYYAANDTVGYAQVQNGDLSTVELVALKPVRIAARAGTAPKVRMTIQYHGPLRAPIAQGQEVARLFVEIEGMPDSELPLIATHDVGEAGILQRILNGIRGWFS